MPVTLTPYLALPLPEQEGSPYTDIQRVRESLQALDAQHGGIDSAVAALGLSLANIQQEQLRQADVLFDLTNSY